MAPSPHRPPADSGHAPATPSEQGWLTGPALNHVGFPLGGLGGGMFCLGGDASFNHVSFEHRPQLGHDPALFAAVGVRGRPELARVVEGPTPRWKAYAKPGAGEGLRQQTYGLPRWADARFRGRFPFADITLTDPDSPLRAGVHAWSPFIPGDTDSVSLPVAALTYTFDNKTEAWLEAVFSFHAVNFLAQSQARRGGIRRRERGFVLSATEEDAQDEVASFCAELADVPNYADAPVSVDAAWFRGGWFDPRTVLWRHVEAADTVDQPPHTDGEPGSGASVYQPLTIAPGTAVSVTLLLSWYAPRPDVHFASEACYRPWYAERFASHDALADHWRAEHDTLRQRSARFRDALFDTTLPEAAQQAVASNLSILKSPTLLRQHDGRVWGWEGCGDGRGCCPGSCTHVWNYAQALPHLMPALERTLRESEFGPALDERGHQLFRIPLPIDRTAGDEHNFHAAADGQLGTLIKLYRDWRISGDTDWLKQWWPAARRCLDFAIKTWDPDECGAIIEPHHNTYDIEFWGAEPLCTGFYLGALHAACAIGDALGESDGDHLTRYQRLAQKCRRFMEDELFNGEYFVQRIRWRDLRAPSPTAVSGIDSSYSPEARELLEKEGPKYQFGDGCLADGALGLWLAKLAGLGDLVNPQMVRSHLLAVHRHNFKPSLRRHANVQRSSYAFGEDGGLILCSWPRGGRPTLPFVYSDEVWTGVEHQVASHLMLHGCFDEARQIVSASRARYDGMDRNPYDEYECGHWYARAMSSYALIQGYSGMRYDAVDARLEIADDLPNGARLFLSTATGFGTVRIEAGQPHIDVIEGEIPIRSIDRTRR